MMQEAEKEASINRSEQKKERKELAKSVEKAKKAGKQRALNEQVQEEKRYRPSSETLKAMKAVAEDVEGTEHGRALTRSAKSVYKVRLHHELENTERAKLQEEIRRKEDHLEKMKLEKLKAKAKKGAPRESPAGPKTRSKTGTSSK
jgi:hypothetical protein